jgi:O-antigen ligase
VLPGADLFLRYGRAKAAFEDPNVFGPFLILPAMFALQKVLLGTPRHVFWASIVFMIIFIGVFVSFSRAAWGHMVLSSLMVFVLGFLLRADAREKVRMLILAMAGAAMLAVALIGLLSIPEVADLFAQRASAEQNYDTGETGRFGRQAYAFDLALANPWGIGPGEFFNLRITEQPHNTYVSVLHVYGWGGGLAFYLFILLTLWHGVRLLIHPSGNRMLMIPLIAVFLPLSLEAAIIDTDHWRHLFLVAGMIWGVAAGYWRVPKGQSAHSAALI